MKCAAVIASLVLAAGSAQGAVTGVTLMAMDTTNIDVFGTAWNGAGNPGDLPGPDDDWWYDIDSNGDATVEVRENWIGTGSVPLLLGVTTDNLDPNVGFIKTLENNSGVMWSTFLIEISDATPGPITLNPGASSDKFADVTAIGSPGDPVFLVFDNGTVAPGESVVFNFSFFIPDGTPSIEYTITQTPNEIPAPSGIAVLGLAGLAAVRRRR